MKINQKFVFLLNGLFFRDDNRRRDKSDRIHFIEQLYLLVEDDRRLA